MQVATKAKESKEAEEWNDGGESCDTGLWCTDRILSSELTCVAKGSSKSEAAAVKAAEIGTSLTLTSPLSTVNISAEEAP